MSKQIIKLGEKFQNKYMIKLSDELSESERMKRDIINSAEKFPYVNGKNFVDSLKEDNINVDIYLERKGFWAPKITITYFVFQENTSQEIKNKYKAIPLAIEKFVNSVGMNYEGSKWKINLPD